MIIVSSSPPPKTKSKTIGILGGMGPLASAEFLWKLLECIPANKDWDYPRIILDSNTHIPSRSRAYAYNEDSPLPGMIAACRQLEQYSPTCIALPCNSAQAWLAELQTSLATPVLNIFQAVTEKLQCDFSPDRPVMVLGGAITYGRDTYKPYIEKAGFHYHKLDEAIQKNVESFIESAKKTFISGDLAQLTAKCKNILETACSTTNIHPIFIFGCTEFGMVADTIKDHYFIDSLHAYAKYTADYS
ncbi:MAG: aspartate/glutamate racemase family protein [Deltaproteobacteria bacterium]|jgi:aspartate racemase|nr:aspartate/glutamate racemase family protein [Deltaproteobacteria bacterium]